jgi:hypothetical protein
MNTFKYPALNFLMIPRSFSLAEEALQSAGNHEIGEKSIKTKSILHPV